MSPKKNSRKKEIYFDQAKTLFVEHLKTIGEIAEELPISTKTIINWKNEGNWDQSRAEFLQKRQSLHSDLYEFARELLKGIREDMKNGKKVESQRLYALTNILGLLKQSKKYEEERGLSEEERPKEVNNEEIIQELESILGVKLGK